MIPAGRPPVQLSSGPRATYQVRLTKSQFYAFELAKSSETKIL